MLPETEDQSEGATDFTYKALPPYVHTRELVNVQPLLSFRMNVTDLARKVTEGAMRAQATEECFVPGDWTTVRSNSMS